MRSRKRHDSYPKSDLFTERLRREYERLTSNQLELPDMSSEEKRSFLDVVFDKADEIADKLVAGAAHVHTPNKEYPETPPIAEVIASGTQSIASGTQSFLMAPIENTDGRGAVWHIFAQSSTALCGLKNQSPGTFWRANKSSRAAILTCFGCLSHALPNVSQPKPVLELKP